MVAFSYVFDAVSKTALISLDSLHLVQKQYPVVQLIASSPHQISTWSAEKWARKWNQKVLLSTDWPCGHGESHWKCFKTEEVNHAYKQVWKSLVEKLYVMFDDKVFAMQDVRPPANQTDVHNW